MQLMLFQVTAITLHEICQILVAKFGINSTQHSNDKQQTHIINLKNSSDKCCSVIW